MLPWRKKRDRKKHNEELDFLFQQNECYKHYLFMKETLVKIKTKEIHLPYEETIFVSENGRSLEIWRTDAYLSVYLTFINQKAAKMVYRKKEFQIETKLKIQDTYQTVHLEESSLLRDIKILMKQIRDHTKGMTI